MKSVVRKSIAVLGAAVLSVACGSSTTESTTQTSQPPATSTPYEAVAATPLLASVVAAPVPVPASDGKVHLAYELQVINAMGSDVTMTSLAVKDEDKTVLSLAGDELAYWTRILGAPGTPTTKFAPAQAGIVWLDVAFDQGAPIPRELSHTIDVTLSKPMPPLLPPTMTEHVAPVTVSDHQPAVISPPLDGPKWLDANSCCDMTAHRNAMNPLNGQLWAAERFAIDYVQLGADDTIYHGDRSKPESYPYFGADIHAVADGPVVTVMDGLPEQVAGQTPTGLPLEHYGGNHIVQDIGGGNYAFYAHLRTGSVKVKPGDRLTTGQVIANLGNTGNTDAPHLHFHVMSTPDPLRSDGLPFVFQSYELEGAIASMDALDPVLLGQPAPLKPGFTPRAETKTTPLVLDVMSYATG
jgi:Peptidase family M23